MIHLDKKQKVEDNTAYKEVLLNTDTLSKIISYLPSISLLNLALTCKTFGILDDDDLSVIKKSAHISVEEIATVEQLAALPHYDGENSLADYHYLQLMRSPLLFDQLVRAEYVNSGDKSCVNHSGNTKLSTSIFGWETALSNNVLRTGKHYVSFTTLHHEDDCGNFWLGVMRPGKANQNASGSPVDEQFYQNFSRRLGHGDCNNNVHCCMYGVVMRMFLSSNWDGSRNSRFNCDGLERMSSGELGMLLDLDEGTLSVYKNGRKLVMKRGLAGPYCWVASIGDKDARVTIKRGTIPINTRL